MNRQYEDPRKLEKELARLQEEYENFMLANDQKMISLHPNADGLCEIAHQMREEIEELKERVNFAWQDEAYDEACAAEAIRLGEEALVYG